jgi:tyrosyl-tRNA synthetase
MSKEPSKKELEEFFSRGVAEVIDKKALIKLMGERKIRVYYGIDPTGADVHIGHAIPLRKLRQLQDWGHQVVLLIGDFTAMIGDPTGKDAMRVPLTTEQVLDNAKDYVDQVSSILDFEGENPVEVKYNSHWLAKMTFSDVVDLSSHFTVQQMLERDMFANRIKDGKPVGLHEFLYPLMQGYDTVAMDMDLELGGSDQLFNMLAGRTLKAKLRNEEKHVMTSALLEGADGRKMSKTYDNHIPIKAEPADMYGKVMAVKDELLEQYFWLSTDLEKKEIDKLLKADNPKEAKMRLGRELVAMFHGEDAAKDAEQAWVNQFQKGALPEDIEEFVAKPKMLLIDVLVDSGLASSKSDARRVIEQGGVKLNDEAVTDIKEEVSLQNGDIIQKGKRGYRKIVI